MKAKAFCGLCVVAFLLCGGCKQKNAQNILMMTSGPALRPVSPYEYAQLLVYDLDKEKQIAVYDLEGGMLGWDIDLVMTKDQQYGLVVSTSGVDIFNVQNGKVAGGFDWAGQLPPPGVDIAITPDDKTGLVMRSSQLTPVPPFMHAEIDIFSIPEGEVLGTVSLGTGQVAWDLDIQITPDGSKGLVATTDGIVVFEIPSGEVLFVIDTKGMIPSLGVDLVITPDGERVIAALSPVSITEFMGSYEVEEASLPPVFPSAILEIYEISSGKEIAAITAENELVNWEVDIQLTPDGEIGLFTCAHSVILFDTWDGYILAEVPLDSHLPQMGSDLAVTPDGKIGIINYGSLTYPPATYLPVKFKFFSIPDGSVFKELELNHSLLTSNLDLVLTPDGTYLLIPISGRVVIIETASGEPVAEISTRGSTPQLGVDVAVTPDGQRGIIFTTSATYPATPYAYGWVQIFSIPYGELLAEVDMAPYGAVTWDVDLTIDGDGSRCLVSYEGGVIVIDTRSGEVLQQIDRNGYIPQIGNDMLITNPPTNAPDADEDFINPYVFDLEQKITTTIIAKEGVLILPERELPEKVTLPVENAMQMILRQMSETLTNRADLFKNKADYEKMIGFIKQANEGFDQNDRKKVQEAIGNASAYVNQHEMKTHIAGRVMQNLFVDLILWSEKPAETVICLQPLGKDASWLVWYLSSMSKEHKPEVFKAIVEGSQPGSDASVTATPLREPAPDPLPPSILSVDFAVLVKGNGEPGNGWVDFLDENGDITEVVFTPLLDDNTAYQCVSAGEFRFNPMDFIVSGDRFRGLFSFHQYCSKCSDDASGEITTQVQLFDATGLSSEPITYSFMCD